jgi:hypothetical protein
MRVDCVPGQDVVEWEYRELVTMMVRCGGRLWSFGPEGTGWPILTAVAEWESVADVAILAAPDQAVGYRAPLHPDDSPLSPRHVCWHLVDTPVHVLRAVLCLDTPDTAMPIYATPDACRVVPAGLRATPVDLSVLDSRTLS